MLKHRLSKSLPIPLYHQLKRVIWEQIQRGELRPAQQLPTEDELTRQYGVSKTTVRQALRELAMEGWVRREQGRGTFVTNSKIEQGPLELTSFTQDMARLGLTPNSRVLRQDVVTAQGEIREKLQLAEADPVLRLRRLRLANGEPMGLQTAHLPLALCPGLEKEPFESQSLYRVLESKFGLLPAFAREVHSAVALGRAEARLLKVAERSPALMVERLTFLADERPLELVYSVMRGDKYKTILHLRNPRLSL